MQDVLRQFHWSRRFSNKKKIKVPFNDGWKVTKTTRVLWHPQPDYSSFDVKDLPHPLGGDLSSLTPTFLSKEEKWVVRDYTEDTVPSEAEMAKFSHEAQQAPVAGVKIERAEV